MRGLTLAMPGRRALERRNQRILSPGQYPTKDDNDAIAASATILEFLLVSRDSESMRSEYKRAHSVIAVRKALQVLRRITLESVDSEGAALESNYEEKKVRCFIVPRRCDSLPTLGMCQDDQSRSRNPSLRLPENANAKSCKNIQRKRRSLENLPGSSKNGEVGHANMVSHV
ncbi:hypothetical protein Tco_0643917 [Tanacetum coccineum]